MKTSKERDAMTKQVQAAFAKWPTFEKVPVALLSDKHTAVSLAPPFDQNAYIAALYEAASRGKIVARREKTAELIIEPL